MNMRSALSLCLLAAVISASSTPCAAQVVMRKQPVPMQSMPAPVTRPAQLPRAQRPATPAVRIEAGRVLDRTAAQVAVRPIADCAAKPTIMYGQMQAGQKTTIRFADADESRRGTVAVVNGEPVYKPDLAAANAPRAIMPRLQRLTMSYNQVMVSSAPDTMRNGWFGSPDMTIATGTIIKDNRDGTAEVILPAAPNAIFAQKATLVVVTDRCTIQAPIAIRPPMHVGRWFPPVLITRCMFRNNPVADFYASGEMTPDSRLEQQLRADRPIEGAFQPHNRHHNCGPYGALHEGGNAQGAGGGTGTDTYLFWDGGFDPAFSVTEAFNRTAPSCVVKVERFRRLNGGAYLGRPEGIARIAKHASRSLLEVHVTWRIDADHGYCWYTLVAKGRHPVSLPDGWRTLFSPNHLGLKSTMIHSGNKTDLIWLQDTGDSRGRRVTATAEF